MLVRLAKKYRPLHSKNKVENFAIGGRAEGRASPVIHRTPCTPRRAGCPHPAVHRTPCKNPVIAKPVRTLAVAIRSPRPLRRGITDDPVAVPKISTLPYGGRWKF